MPLSIIVFLLGKRNPTSLISFKDRFKKCASCLHSWKYLFSVTFWEIFSLVETKYGPNSPFWITSMGQSLFEFGITRPYFVNPSIGASLY